MSPPIHPMMVRAAVLFVVVVVVQFLLGALLSWLTPRANWAIVAGAVNTVLLSSVVLTVQQFRHEGLTLYAVFFAVLMLWLAAGAAKMGTHSLRQIRQRTFLERR